MHKSLIALSILGAANVANAEKNQENCAPEPPAVCYADDCQHCYCLGPENMLANAPVNPRTCNGDWVVRVAGFYWNAHQDGMEYAIDNHVKNPDQNSFESSTQELSDFSNVKAEPDEIAQLNNLINADYKTPDFEWNWGFKAGLGYNTTCDGWDFGINWTWYRGKANDHIEAEADDNHTLIGLWTALPDPIAYFTDIETHWKLDLNLIDLELGREYWTSKYLSFRPFVGLRIAFIKQNFEIQHKGGVLTESTGKNQFFRNNEVDMGNDFKGVGIRSGFDTTWNFGCGWALFGNFAASVVYGRFSIDHDEEIREAEAPFSKSKVLETKDTFHASRAMVDLALGIQWSSMFCDCQYGFTVALGWENHLFFHQNQFWRVQNIGIPAEQALTELGQDIQGGENGYFQRRGTLDTQGWTLTLQFEF